VNGSPSDNKSGAQGAAQPDNAGKK